MSKTFYRNCRFKKKFCLKFKQGLSKHICNYSTLLLIKTKLK